MKKKYKDRVDKVTNQLSKACSELSKGLIDISLDGSLDTDFEFIEKNQKLYYRVEFTLPVMSLKQVKDEDKAKTK